MSSLPFFYEPNLHANENLFDVQEANAHHMLQVLRMKQGEKVNVTNGQGLILNCSIASASKKTCTLQKLDQQFVPKPANEIAIGISLVKNNTRFEWFLEKATEIGMQTIIPLLCHRTEKQHFRYDRMQQICVSAMLQSQQYWLPHLHAPTSFADVLEMPFNTKMIAHCLETDKKQLSDLSAETSKLMLIGPEGDFTEAEIQAAIAKQFVPIMLGETRLRTETAGVVAATLLMQCKNK
jgi:16S rRNA (uracil1498-N3)-methyltransferase